MTRYTRPILCIFLTGLLACGVSVADEKAQSSADEKGTKTKDVQVKDITLKIPTTWKMLPNSNSMRLATIEIPPAGDDDVPAELTVFNFPGGGGGIGSNLSRWVGQFDADGRTVQTRKGKAGKNSYVVTTITGTYHKPIGPPIRRQTEDVEGYAASNVILTLEDGNVYYLKLVGPKATIKAQEAAYRNVFGGNMETEEDYEI